MASEEQTLSNTSNSLSSFFTHRMGQRLTISDRLVSTLSFYLAKIGSPTGDVTFTIRRVSDDLVLVSKVMGDASVLPDDVAPGPTWKVVNFDIPIVVDE